MKEAIQQYAFREGLNLEFEILNLSERLITKRDKMIVPHRAQFHHILWIEKGKGTHYVDFKPIEVKDNLLLFIPQNSVNLYDELGQYDGKAMLFTDKFFSKNSHDLQFLRTTRLFSDLYDTAHLAIKSKDSDLKLFFDAIEKEFNGEPDSAQFSLLHNMLHVFLLKAEREMDTQGFVKLEPSANLDCLVLFKDLLEQNFSTNKSVQKYASQLCISEKQLYKATKTLLDKTPKQIIDERITLEAKRLLAHSSESIKKVAYNLGYDEPTNFVKYFRKHTQSTPSEFRENF